MNWFELAIIAFIALSIMWHVWKGGAANPVGTGSLGRQVAALSGRVAGLGQRVGYLEKGVEDLKEEAASTKDVQRLEATIEGHRELAERTFRSVDRIERALIEKGMGK